MKHALKQMQYRFTVIYETPSTFSQGRIKCPSSPRKKKGSALLNLISE